jgi:hypothetical protein
LLLFANIKGLPGLLDSRKWLLLGFLSVCFIYHLTIPYNQFPELPPPLITMFLPISLNLSHYQRFGSISFLCHCWQTYPPELGALSPTLFKLYSLLQCSAITHPCNKALPDIPALPPSCTFCGHKTLRISLVGFVILSWPETLLTLLCDSMFITYSWKDRGIAPIFSTGSCKASHLWCS